MIMFECFAALSLISKLRRDAVFVLTGETIEKKQSVLCMKMTACIFLTVIDKKDSPFFRLYFISPLSKLCLPQFRYFQNNLLDRLCGLFFRKTMTAVCFVETVSCSCCRSKIIMMYVITRHILSFCNAFSVA